MTAKEKAHQQALKDMRACGTKTSFLTEEELIKTLPDTTLRVDNLDVFPDYKLNLSIR